MSIHIDSNSRLHHDQEASFALVCPHCQVLSHMTAVSIPQFTQLSAHKPNHVGIVYRCDSCNAPVFLKFPVKIYASMCRRTAQSVFRDLGENGKLRIFDMVADIRTMAELDTDTYTLLKKILFDNDADGYPGLPTLGGEHAGILLEVMKDLLYQSYIRRGKLQQAMMVRRFFAEESQSSKVTPFLKASS